MKKLLLVLCIGIMAILPAFAVCPVSGVCSSEINNQVLPTGIQGKYLYDNLENIKNPNDFMPKHMKSYDSLKINTAEPATEFQPENINPNPIYDGCPFGICQY